MSARLPQQHSNRYRTATATATATAPASAPLPSVRACGSTRSQARSVAVPGIPGFRSSLRSSRSGMCVRIGAASLVPSSLRSSGTAGRSQRGVWPPEAESGRRVAGGSGRSGAFRRRRSVRDSRSKSFFGIYDGNHLDRWKNRTASRLAPLTTVCCCSGPPYSAVAAHMRAFTGVRVP